MAQNNLERMRTLDDSWNAQDRETFEKDLVGLLRQIGVM